LDEQIFRSFYGARDGGLTGLAAAFSFLGQGWIILAFVPLLLIRRHRERTAALIGVLVITAGAVAGLKLLVRRARPCNSLTGIRCLAGDAPTDFSFPSGHAAGSFAFAAFVIGILLLSTEPRGWKHRLLAGAVGGTAGCIALSRVYLGVHFPGDIFAGSCLGAAIGFLGARLHLRRVRPEGADAPTPTLGRRSTETRT
jgi:undecaprenyl-diphosphatase